MYTTYIFTLLLYGCEIWGFDDNVMLVKVPLKFCKMILNIKVFIPNNMIYGELGRYPVEIDNKLSTISFRANIFVDSNPKYHAL